MKLKRTITGEDVLAAAQVNDAVILEHGGGRVAKDLSLDPVSLMREARVLGSTQQDSALAFGTGVFAGVRAVSMVQSEAA
jgi:hypothetical protein